MMRSSQSCPIAKLQTDSKTGCAIQEQLVKDVMNQYQDLSEITESSVDLNTPSLPNSHVHKYTAESVVNRIYHQIEAKSRKYQFTCSENLELGT